MYEKHSHVTKLTNYKFINLDGFKTVFLKVHGNFLHLRKETKSSMSVVPQWA